MTSFNKIIAFIMFIISLISGLSLSPSKPDASTENDTIMFVSDFQGNNRENSFSEIVSSMNSQPGLIVCGGDYQSTLGVLGASDFGISTMKDIVNKKWTDNNIQYLFVQGNHDPSSTEMLNSTGLYEFDSYLMYLINEDDFPKTQNSSSSKKDIVMNTATKLNDALNNLVANGETRPVFIVTHVPLHYSSRNVGKDNTYAQYVFDVVNENAKKLDIVFLFGHNHSGTYDDYIGGAVNLLQKGDTLYLGGSNEERILNFTYTNCGYIGYSSNTVSDTSTDTLTATTVTIHDDYLEIQKHSKDGDFYENSIIVNRTNSVAKLAA